MHLHIPSNSSVTTPLIPSPSLFLYSFPISASRIVIATHMETCCKCLNSPYSVRGVIYYKSEVRVCCFIHLRQQLLLLLLKASEEIPQEVAMILGEGLSFQQIQREVFILTCGKSKKGAELQAWGEREQARQAETSCTVVQSTEGRLEGLSSELRVSERRLYISLWTRILVTNTTPPCPPPGLRGLPRKR